MPFLRPDLTSLQQQAVTDITAANLPSLTGQLLPQAVLRVLAYAQAGLAWLHFSYLDWIAQQSVPWTATDEYLEAWAALKGIVRKPATAARGQITFTGVDTSVVPAGAQVARLDNTLYTTDSDITISTGSGVGNITAVITGANGNADMGISLSLSNSITGINATATTSSSLTGGADIEATDALRTRMLQIYANPPQGGDASDYVEWALQVSGVTRAWCLPNGAGSGTVTVYTMWDLSESAFNGFPQGVDGGATLETRTTPAAGDQLTVANYIYPLRPVTALVFSAAPVAFPIDITIGSLTPSNTAIKTAIAGTVTSTLQQIGSPLGMTVFESDLTTSIASVPGVQEFVLLVPATTTAVPVGSLPTLGTITYS